MSKSEFMALPADIIERNTEQSSELADSVRPIVEQQKRLKEVTHPLSEQHKSMTAQLKVNSPAYERLSNIQKSLADVQLNTSHIAIDVISDSLKSMALRLTPIYSEIPTGKLMESASHSLTSSIAVSLQNIVPNFSPVLLDTIQSPLLEWIKSFNFYPLTSILENIKDIGIDYNYEEVNEVFLKAMFNARWFPYAGWNADFEIVDEMLEILDTSRASKNRIKRIDKLIFSYYDKNELNNLKRRWRQLNLPSYMTRILVQSVQAYNRREYALTVSALSTLWEGIIQEKAKDNNYRVSKKTRENLTKLIEENEFNKIFSSFCEEFIFYDCRKAEEVKPDVPGRHGIAHCWYDTYPNKKVALNAILFTDFLLRLKPLDDR